MGREARGDFPRAEPPRRHGSSAPPITTLGSSDWNDTTDASIIPADKRNRTDAPLTHSLIAAAALAASFTVAPKPAEAQTVVRVCMGNSPGLVVRSRFTCRDWQGASHTSAWVTSALGQRHCGTLQDLQSLVIEVQGHTGFRWLGLSGCDESFPVRDPKKNAPPVLSGTSIVTTCALEQ